MNTPPPAEPPPSTLALFNNRTFRALWAATVISNFGGLVQAVGAAWMMTALGGSAQMVALVQGSVTLPVMIFSLMAGVLADTFDRRQVMLAAQGFMFAVSILLTLLAALGMLTPWSLLTFTFLIGCGTALNNPSWQATVGDVVGRAELPAAVSLNSMGFNITRSVGPAIGGAIVAIGGAATAFAVNAVSYLGILAVLLRWHPPERDRRLPPEPLGSAFAAGLRYVAMSPNLLRVILRAAVFGLGAVAVLALLPVVVREGMGGTSFIYGILLGCFGVGAIGGALANARLRARFDNEHVARGAFIGFGLASAVLAFSPPVIFAAPAIALAGMCWVLALSMFNTTIQLSAPRWVIGRALALYQTGAFGGMALGSWLWGRIAADASVPMAFAAATVVLAAGAMLGRLAPLPSFGGDEIDPANRFREPPLRLDITRRSGPVMVMVDYEIAEEDTPEFLALMAQRRRIRIRDGAQQWVLLRDMEQPDHWSESYHVPTWIEYIRHNSRRTRGDAGVTDRLRDLHRGVGQPLVHRMIERQTVPSQDDTPPKPMQESS